MSETKLESKQVPKRVLKQIVAERHKRRADKERRKAEQAKAGGIFFKAVSKGVVA